MGLQSYRQKRSFRKTPEPKGHVPHKKSAAKKGLRFFVQEHHASHLHYDFRLEMEGVLRSWAIPKGPSTDPTVKRLAVEVEDHPLEYGSFEGVIPENEYGAGRVILWDRGIWKSEHDPVRSYKKGHLEFELKGKKLHGRWHLVRIKRESGHGKQWLLIKRHDEAATDSEDEDESPDVLSKHDSLPKSIAPQLARLKKTTPTGDRWSHEIKLDGYRILARIEGKRVRLITRSGLDWTHKFESIRAAIEHLGLRNTILDGEIVVLDENGKSDFQALQNAISENRQSALRYYAFDLLFMNRNDLRSWPLSKRRNHLKALFKNSSGVVRFSESISGSGPEFFEECCRHGIEGVVSKRLDGEYRSGRSDDWIKTKCSNRQEFVIGGYTDSTRPGDAFAALLLGVQDDDGLRYVGKTGTGFTASSMRDILRKLRKISIGKSPFTDPVKEKGVHWVKPALVAEVNFASWTANRHVRQASFKGLREDKKAEQVVMETTAPNTTSATEVKISHPNKILFRKAKISKQELADYYTKIEKWILPHIQDRPLTIVRCPNGAEKTCFYQRHIGTMKSPYVKETAISVKADRKKREKYISVDSLNGILTLVQIGSLELHAWNTTIHNADHPTEFIFDLDPGPRVDRKAIYNCALEIKNILGRLNLKSFVNLSGNKGLHIHVPVAPIYTWEAIKSFSHSIVKLLVDQDPDLYTDNARKAKRDGRIFIDYLRNGITSTSVIPYSVRNKSEATVAIPISWSELKPDFDPAGFDIRKTLKRLARLKRDPWRGMRKLEQRVAVLDV